MRVLRLVKLSAWRNRTVALNQMRAIVATGPEELRPLFRDVSVHQLVERAAARLVRAVVWYWAQRRSRLRQLARRVQGFDAEMAEINQLLEPLVAATAPEALSCVGVGTDVASALLVAAGDNPERLRSERTFAHLCGVSPIDAAPSGKNERHRLNRSGDRQANAALWRIVMTRITCDPYEALHRPANEGRPLEARGHALSQALHREGGLRGPTSRKSGLTSLGASISRILPNREKLRSRQDGLT